MVLQPFGVKAVMRISENPFIEYQFIAEVDVVNILYLLPTHALGGGNTQLVCVSIDGSEPIVFNVNTIGIGRSNAWKENVLRNQACCEVPF